MVMSGSSVTRAVDLTGNEIKTYDNDSGEKVQGVVLTDAKGNLQPTNPDIYIPEYNSDGNPVYVCSAESGAETSVGVWQIFKISYDSNGNVAKKRFADGETTFTKIADDYSTFDYTDI